MTVITEHNGAKKVVPRPEHKRNWNSLSDAGSEGSCSSITARMCGIDLSNKNKSNDAPKESDSNDDTLTPNVSYDAMPHKNPTTQGLNDVGHRSLPTSTIAEGVQSQSRNLPDQKSAISSPGAQRHHAQVESQLRNLPHHLAHTGRRLQLAPAQWVQAPPFQPGKAWTSPTSPTPDAHHDQAAQAAQQYMPWGPVLPVVNAWDAASSYNPTPSPYIPQPLLYYVVPVTVVPVLSDRPPPPLQVNNNPSTPSIPANDPTNTDNKDTLKPALGTFSPVPQPEITPFPRTNPQRRGRNFGKSKGAQHPGVYRTNLVPENRMLGGDGGVVVPFGPRSEMPVRRMSLGDLMVRDSGKGKIRKAEKEEEDKVVEEGDGEAKEDAGDKE